MRALYLVGGLVLAGLLDSADAQSLGSKAAQYLLQQNIAEACGGEGTIDPGALIERDLTGDGKDDLLVSHEGISCAGGGRSSFCGAQVCAVNIYVRRGALLEVASEMLGVGVTVGEGSTPEIRMYGHGGESVALRWNGQSFGLPSPAASAGAWIAEGGGGYVGYSTRDGENAVTLSCDYEGTADHSQTGINVEIGGSFPIAPYEFRVDGRSLVFPSNVTGSVTISDCAGCAEKFRELWSLLRAGSRLEVVTADGSKAVFSLKGTSKVMPDEPCPSGPEKPAAVAGEAPRPDAGEGECVPIVFAPGERVVEISGSASPDGVVCHRLATAHGQIVSLEVVDGGNIIFSIRDMVDARDRYEFTADRDSYDILVGQLMRAVDDAPFRIRITASAGGRTELPDGPAAAPQAGEAEVAVSQSGPTPSCRAFSAAHAEGGKLGATLSHAKSAVADFATLESERGQARVRCGKACPRT